MMEILLILVLNMLWIQGFHAITREGYLLESVSKYSVKWFGDFWSNPISECPLCMSSFWGIPGYLFAYSQGLLPFFYGFYFFAYLGALAGLNITYRHILDSRNEE